jgi:hypothetical protein
MNKEEIKFSLTMIESIPENSLLLQISNALKEYSSNRTPENNKTLRRCMHMFAVQNAIKELGSIDALLDTFDKMEFKHSFFNQPLN